MELEVTRDEAPKTKGSTRPTRKPSTRKLSTAVFKNIFTIGNILLFDDDPLFLKIVKKFSDKRHLPLTSVGTFEQFKRQWSQRPPDLVILDYDLESDLLGTHIARLLGDTPVIIISRKTRDITEGQHWSRNIRSFFHKKYGIPRLLSEVHSILGVYPHRDLLSHSNVLSIEDYRSSKRRIA